MWQLNVENSLNAELRLHILKKRYSHVKEAFDKWHTPKRNLASSSAMNVFGAMHDTEEQRKAL